jgi:glycosyltransferase involved in cell wall biosynthesis
MNQARRHVRYVAHLFGATGYEVEAQIAIGQLHRRGYPLEVVARGRRSDSLRSVDPVTRQLLERLIANPPVSSRPAVEVQHVPAPYFRSEGEPPPVPFRVGRTAVEVDRLPSDWLEACRRVDEVWVPSTFNRSVFIESGLAPAKVRVVPIGVDTDLFRPHPGAQLPAIIASQPREEAGRRPGSRGFTFLSVLSWQRRKGWDILLQAYFEEFGANEDVTLIVKAEPFAGTAGEITASFHAFAGETRRRLGRALPRVILAALHLESATLAALYAASDAFVLPSRGEGLGRPYLEAMAAGLPVIGTAWGGNLDFMSQDNSYLIEVEGLEPAASEPGLDFFRGRRWARPSLPHLRELLRRVVEHPEEAGTMGRRARADVLVGWTVDQTGDGLARELDRHF